MDINYYNNIRFDILDLINKNNLQKVLEIGCGNGSTLGYLKKNGYAHKTFGLESNLECKKHAKANEIDYFLVCDVEDSNLKLNETFDVILFLDVLEHLLHPWDVLNNISKRLNKDGLIIISIPNIRNLKILTNLIFKGKWDYELSGILDYTHIRFFTDKSFRNQLNNQKINYSIKHFKRNYDYMSLTKKWMKKIPLLKEFVTCQLIYSITIK